MRKAFIVIILLIAASANAQRRAARVPFPQRVWIVEEKDDWNHAVSELVAFGDQKHYAIPLGTPDGHWLAIHEETVAGDSGSFPWRSESFDSMMDAAVRFESLAPQSTIRKLFTESSGKTVIVYKCKPGVPCGV